MSVMLDWKITVELEGKWSKQSIEDLNAAMNGWWCDWCEYASFFSDIKFSTPEQSVSTTSYSNKIRFDELVDFSANGDVDYLLAGGWDSLETRKGFDANVHQSLLVEMKDHQLMIEFCVDEEYEGEPGEWYTKCYEVTSDGSRFVIKEGQVSVAPGGCIVTAKLCGDWSEQAIKAFNMIMDGLDEEGPYCGGGVAGIHFSEAEKQTTPIAMDLLYNLNDFDYGNIMSDAVSDCSGYVEPEELYQALLDEMKGKNLYGLFHFVDVAPDVDDLEKKVPPEWLSTEKNFVMYSDGESIIFSEQGKEEK